MSKITTFLRVLWPLDKLEWRRLKKKKNKSCRFSLACLVNQHTGSQTAHTVSHATCYVFSTRPLGDMAGEYLGHRRRSTAIEWGRGTEMLRSECVKNINCNSPSYEVTSVLHNFQNGQANTVLNTSQAHMYVKSYFLLQLQGKTRGKKVLFDPMSSFRGLFNHSLFYPRADQTLLSLRQAWWEMEAGICQHPEPFPPLLPTIQFGPQKSFFFCSLAYGKCFALSSLELANRRSQNRKHWF